MVAVGAMASGKSAGKETSITNKTSVADSAAVANAKVTTEIKSIAVDKSVSNSNAVISSIKKQNTVREKGVTADKQTKAIVKAAASAHAIADAEAITRQSAGTDMELNIAKQDVNVKSVAKASVSLKMSASRDKIQKKKPTSPLPPSTDVSTTKTATSQSTALKRVKLKNDDAPIAFQQFGPEVQKNLESKASFVLLCVALTHLPLLSLTVLCFWF